MLLPPIAALVLALFTVFQNAVVGADLVLQTAANVMAEIPFTAQRPHADPFNELALDVTFTDPAGTVKKVPAFWAGTNVWKVRYASPLAGTHHFRSECSQPEDQGLHGVSGKVEVKPYTGNNPLYLRGPLKLSANRRSMEYNDGTPFFWLGDTWWMGLSARLHWPEDVQKLAQDRKEKGFNVIQLVAGLFPDMHPFDPRGANEAGYPWEKDYAHIRPEYFDAADQRLFYLVEQGFTPCIVGAWGYFIPWMGVERAKQHWRNLIARYGAMPVVWCIAGEANLPWYLAKGFPYDDRQQIKDWTVVMRYVRATDPYHRLVTIHPTGIGRLSARNATDDVTLLDFDMLQTPHGQREAVSPTVRTMRESYPDKPVMPVINGEASYEMLNEQIPAAWPRAMFWVCMVNGAAGHTYGANGIWQVNRPGQPHGPSPTAGSPPNGYGKTPWEEAMHFPGSTHMAHGKRFFESLPWTQLVPMPESVAWANTTETGPLGDWIWFPEGDPKRDAPLAARYFRRTFELADKATIRSAALRLAADDKFTVWLNGKELGSGTSWKEPGQFEIASALRTGRNVLAVRAENLPAPVTLNPAGFAAALTFVHKDNAKTSLRTDTAWRAANTEQEGWREDTFADATWPAALVTAKFGEAPWGTFGEANALPAPQACGIGDKLRAIYSLDPRPILVSHLKPGASYRVTHFDPVTGERTPLPAIATDAQGQWHCDPPGHSHDWVLLMERQP